MSYSNFKTHGPHRTIGSRDKLSEKKLQSQRQKKMWPFNRNENQYTKIIKTTSFILRQKKNKLQFKTGAFNVKPWIQCHVFLSNTRKRLNCNKAVRLVVMVKAPLKWHTPDDLLTTVEQNRGRAINSSYGNRCQ